MKVYRFLSWCTHYTVEEENSQNDLNNYREGLISPSYLFLQNRSPLLFGGANTFREEKEMVKYFFASLADAMSVISCLNIDNILIELDLPEDLLRNHIGVGFYDLEERPHTEFRIPYKLLYDVVCSRQLDYFYRAIEFYNANLFNSELMKTSGYQELEKLLQDVPYSTIYQENRLSIYPLFCFEPKNKSHMEFTRESLPYLQDLSKSIQTSRNQNADFKTRIYKILENGDKDRGNLLFDATYPIIAEENEAIKRALIKRSRI